MPADIVKFYPFDFTFEEDGQVYLTLAATVGATADAEIIVDAEVGFVATALVGVSKLQSDLVTDQLAVLVEIKGLGDDRNLENVPTRWENRMGSAQRPGYFPQEMPLAEKAKVKLSLTNLVATATRVWVTLKGYRRIRKG